MSTVGQRQQARRHFFRWDVFAIATLVAAAILLSVVGIPQWLSKQARWQVLRDHVGQIGQLAAASLDGNLHRRLLNPSNHSAELYAEALEPLVRFHSANSDLFYVYTMADQKDGVRFVLDTAASPSLRTKHQLRASRYMQPFKIRSEYEDGWVKQLAAGIPYVTPTYEHDDYGYFLSAHAPIFDSQDRYSGFIGVDFDMNYYLSQEARFRMIEIGTLIAAALVSTLIGFLFALYYGDLQRRFRQLFYRATRDELTGLLNHHRANELVDETLNGNSANCAMLLVSIDHPKMLIARHGHCVADAVIADAANVLRKGFDKNLLARIGEGEFIVFVEDCDLPQAKDIARSILTDLSQNHAPIAGVTFSVSIGIAVSDGTANFASLCSDAEAALYSVRVEGNGPIGVANESRLKKDIVFAS